MNRKEIADLIVAKLEREESSMRDCYVRSKDKIGMFTVDDLLPEELAHRLYVSFPDRSAMKLRKSLRESKYIAVQMNQYSPILEEAIFAFQDPRVVSIVSRVCENDQLLPDESLYAGGISLMANEQFLNPHLDNSHDKDRNRWRVFNLLYYVTPDWKVEDGGNLELWPDGMSGDPLTIHSKFNRLAVMATHQGSWHSVSPVKSRSNRCCISNYYFSNSPLKETDRFHVTSFRGRPGQRFRDFILKGDRMIRMLVRGLFRKGVVENKHVYRKSTPQ
ncbi:MAG: 2OG-Fe(II) oxygenase [Planctomycetaceae bacterium]|nr:2OG-Fe(II) oxygenase [Planctomycetaceae bacterium]